MVRENTEKLDPKEDQPEATMADARGKVKKDHLRANMPKKGALPCS